jgi:hypothetical protein
MLMHCDRRQMTEVRRQRTENIGQREENRILAWKKKISVI